MVWAKAFAVFLDNERLSLRANHPTVSFYELPLMKLWSRSPMTLMRSFHFLPNRASK